MFRPPVKVNPDREAQQIQSKLGVFNTVEHLLDDPKSSIGVYGEPASPAPEFKKPHYTSSQNGRSHQRPQHYGKFHEGMPVGVHNRAPPTKLYNDKTPPSALDPCGVFYNVENIIKEMKSLPIAITPLTAIAATPRKESVPRFNFNVPPLLKPIENSSQSNSFPEPKKGAHIKSLTIYRCN
ncbi:uncharacterized protein LOC143918266 [Arctopsyche grandis]|uniref:uncharacterized protein LOC143918266 n=1 Tax=Arctopsyche grandis TaxID=121162 RepID=UPI00406D753D